MVSASDSSLTRRPRCGHAGLSEFRTRTMAVKWDSSRLEAAVRQGALAGVNIAAERVRTTATQSILKGPKSGKIYKRRSVEHQASAPGEAPASDTGRLAQSSTVSLDAQRIAARVNYSTAYAASLEFGTEKMEPRPFLRPALERNKEQIERDVNGEIRKAILAVKPTASGGRR